MGRKTEKLQIQWRRVADCEMSPAYTSVEWNFFVRRGIFEFWYFTQCRCWAFPLAVSLIVLSGVRSTRAPLDGPELPSPFWCHFLYVYLNFLMQIPENVSCFFLFLSLYFQRCILSCYAYSQLVRCYSNKLQTVCHPATRPNKHSWQGAGEHSGTFSCHRDCYVPQSFMDTRTLP